MSMEKMKIEIWSDIACPYCFIGKKKLEAALLKFPHADKVELIWHSYELNSSLGNGDLGISHMDFYEDKKDALEELYQLAEGVGIKFNFEKLIVTNTSDALRTIKFARKYNLAAETSEAFFLAYFTETKCISDRDVIRELALKVGLPVEELFKSLDSNEYIAELTEDIRYSEDKLDLEYIPFYLFNNKTVIQGSIPNEVYLETLEKSFEDWTKNGVATQIDESMTGKGCSIDGKGCK